MLPDLLPTFGTGSQSGSTCFINFSLLPASCCDAIYYSFYYTISS
jgi:hypothetical protein